MARSRQSLRPTRLLAPLALTAALVAAPLHAQMPQQPAQEPMKPEAAFQRADTNADGRLSKEEAARMPAIGAKFAELDKNKDGFLSLDEFSSAFYKADK